MARPGSLRRAARSDKTSVARDRAVAERRTAAAP
jgi:hypothetical protein